MPRASIDEQLKKNREAVRTQRSDFRELKAITRENAIGIKELKATVSALAASTKGLEANLHSLAASTKDLEANLQSLAASTKALEQTSKAHSHNLEMVSVDVHELQNLKQENWRIAKANQETVTELMKIVLKMTSKVGEHDKRINRIEKRL